jgi:biopolymer transport protein ExbD
MAAGTGGDGGEPEFQIAPMIDVLLVLLIFFMSITTTQVLKIDTKLQLPIAPDAVKKDSTRAEAIVNVRWDEAKKKATYVMDEKIYADSPELSKALAVAKKIGDAKVTHGAKCDVLIRTRTTGRSAFKLRR